MKNDMQISEQQLMQMTRDMDEMHRDLFPRFQAHIADVCDDARGQLARVTALAGRDASRRSFLRGGLVTAGVVGGGAALAACGGSSTSSSAPASAAANGTDLQVARLAASLEVLAVNTYAAAIMAASPGQPLAGMIPASVAQFATTAQMQHQDHANAWNATLQSAGQAAQKDPDPKLNGTVQTALGQVKSAGDVAKLALMLENIALQTYTNGAGVVTSTVARLQALTIAPVEAQHAAILNFVLGQYPVPDTFIPVALARSPADLG